MIWSAMPKSENTIWPSLCLQRWRSSSLSGELLGLYLRGWWWSWLFGRLTLVVYLWVGVAGRLTSFPFFHCGFVQPSLVAWSWRRNVWISTVTVLSWVVIHEVGIIFSRGRQERIHKLFFSVAPLHRLKTCRNRQWAWESCTKNCCHSWSGIEHGSIDSGMQLLVDSSHTHHAPRLDNEHSLHRHYNNCNKYFVASLDATDGLQVSVTIYIEFVSYKTCLLTHDHPSHIQSLHSSFYHNVQYIKSR